MSRSTGTVLRWRQFNFPAQLSTVESKCYRRDEHTAAASRLWRHCDFEYGTFTPLQADPVCGPYLKQISTPGEIKPSQEVQTKFDRQVDHFGEGQGETL